VICLYAFVSEDYMICASMPSQVICGRRLNVEFNRVRVQESGFGSKNVGY
jgi:hypothetical protein